MLDRDIKRLRELEVRVKEIFEEEGLLTTDILFEISSPEKMIEAMAYRFPENFSHWSFGRDYERHRTIYEHTGGGIPYEVVWDFRNPKALLVDTNPFALNALIMCHVFGHVDFFLGNRFLKHAHDDVDIAREAKRANERFGKYAEKYGREAVERIVEAGMSVQWLQDPDPLAEEATEEEIREHLLGLERAKLVSEKGTGFGKKMAEEEIRSIEARIRELRTKTPPRPEPDILKYIIERSPKLRDWERDVLSVIRAQARFLAPQRRTKLLNEGWATYWHVKVMRRLFKEGFLDDREHGIFVEFHRKVLRENKTQMNWYLIGVRLFDYIEERWNKGRFGREYDECERAQDKAGWDTKAMLGRDKILRVRSGYTDRMAIEEFFSGEFIRREKLFIWQEIFNPGTGLMESIIVEDRPEVIRRILMNRHTLYGSPVIKVEDGNYNSQGEFYLRHYFTGFELDPRFENGTMENIYYMWGNPVHLETFELDENIMGRQIKKELLHTFDGDNHKIEKQ